MIAKPGRIFYTDVPNSWESNPDTTCSTADNDSFCHYQSYAAHFPSQARVYACPQGDLLNGLPQYTGCAAAAVQNELFPGGGVTARRGGFYNQREDAWVYMLNVNLHDLLDWNRATGNPFFNADDATDGGLVIYLTVVGPGSSSPVPPNPRYGVRVFGTPDLDFPPRQPDPTGVTLVSDQAFYLEGNYNVGDVNFPKMPAAVMADAVNVLSQSWSGGTGAGTGWTGLASCRNDCQSFQTLTARPGAVTTVNAAFLSGVDITTAGNYNGGFENYPRFHENWSGAALNYRGSFVSLGKPAHNTGAWCGTGGSTASGCNIYNPPLRLWNYDMDFQIVENLPPLTPRVVAVQQILFTENFR
jgi:hypothetical protein